MKWHYQDKIQPMKDESLEVAGKGGDDRAGEKRGDGDGGNKSW